MEHLVQADAEIARGRFQAALENLAEAQPRQRSRHYLSHQLSTAEALQLTGRNDRARRLAAAGLRAAGRTRVTEARALGILARAAFETGQIKRSRQLFQRAQAMAERAHDRELLATIQLDMLEGVADWLPPGEAGRVATESERAATFTGNPHLAARYHVVAAGRRLRLGLADQAAAHLRMADMLLQANPNPWLEGRLHLTRAKAHAARREAAAGARHARKALACARLSGHAVTVGAAHAELAHIQLAEGRLRHAFRRCSNGLQQAVGGFPVRVRLLELLAQVELVQGRLRECEALLASLQEALKLDDGYEPSWHDLAMLVLQARLQLQQHAWRAGLATCEAGLETAAEWHDRLHCSVFCVLGADALIEMQRLPEAALWLDRAWQQSESQPLAVRAQVERAGAALLARSAGTATARSRFALALRVLAAEADAAARMDAAASFIRTANPVDQQLRRQIRQQLHDLGPLVAHCAVNGDVEQSPVRGLMNGGWPILLPHTVPLMDLGERPALLAAELFGLLRNSGCASSIAILEQQDERVTSVQATMGCTPEQAARTARTRTGAVVIPVGAAGGRDLSVLVVPRTDVIPRTVVRDIQVLASSARTIASTRTIARARSAQWLPDLAPARHDGVFASARMTGLLARARRIAASDEPVLIVGETGTGKEVIARLIHQHSARARKEFTAFNCSEVPTGMAESVLFGHRAGAYTGASMDYGGVIRGAEGGTLLLDEIADLESSVQPKLLRFLDRGDVHPLGEQKPVHVDVRIIAATNRVIDQRLRDGKLREDLYFRLNVMRLDIPPLRERREEIPVLVHHFLRRFGAARGIPGLTVTDEVQDELCRYDWPGNVRQLENHMRRLAALATEDVVESSGLAPTDSPHGTAASAPEATTPEAAEPDRDALRVRTDQPLADAVAEVERALIRRALADAGGNASAAARRLGVSRRGLQLKRRRLGVDEMGVD